MPLDLQAPNFSALASLAGTRVGNLGLPMPKRTGFEGLAEGFQAGQQLSAQKQLAAQQLAAQKEQHAAQNALEQQKLGLLQTNQSQQNALESRKLDILQKQEEDKNNVATMQANLKAKMELNKEQLNQRGAVAAAYIVGYKQAGTPEEQQKVKDEVLGHGHKIGALSDNDFTTLDKMTPEQAYKHSLVDLMVTNKAAEVKSLIGGKQGEGALTAGSQPLEKAELTRQQQSETQTYDRFRKMEGIASKYADDYLTLGGRAKGAYGDWASYLGVTDKVPGGQEASDFTAKREGFTSSVNQLFSQYVHDMTGAQMTMQEFDRRKAEMINSYDSPVTFKAKFKALMDDMKAGVELKNEWLKKGLPINSPQFEEAFSQRTTAAKSKLEEDLNAQKKSGTSGSATTGGTTAPSSQTAPSTYNYQGKTYTDTDIDETAKSYGISREEVLKHMGY